MADMTTAPDRIETARLAAERLQRGHYDWIYALHQDAKVMATLGGLRSADETRRYLETNMAHWERHGFGLWILRDQESGHFVGRAGLRRMELEGVEEIELAYALAGGYWGRGLATEFGQAALEVAFEFLDISELVCFAVVDNRASFRVMEKLGFTDPRPLDYQGTPCVLYRLRKADWQSTLT
ncbi:MAG: GNAT family N-acetyltransferase [Pseudomonadota bacterium]